MKAVSTLFVSIAIAILFFWTLLICALNAGANAIRNIGQNELDEDGSERKRKAKVDEPDEF
jgi:hypothetical protein